MLLTPFRDHLPLLGLEDHPDLLRWTRCDRSFDVVPLDDDPVCSLVSRLDVNYFHWIVDLCSLLEGLDVYSDRTGGDARLLIRRGAPPFVRDSLTILGVDHRRIDEWPVPWRHGQAPATGPTVARHVKRLVIPSWRHYRWGLSPASLGWLRGAFLRGAGARVEAVTDIYIDRDAAAWRGVENAAEIRELLGARGFEIVRPETLALDEQVKLFARARVVVGMHGAGLTNILFAPRACLVELIGGYGGGDYFSMARGLGNAFVRLVCDDRGENIVVDPTSLIDVLDSLA